MPSSLASEYVETISRASTAAAQTGKAVKLSVRLLLAVVVCSVRGSDALAGTGDDALSEREFLRASPRTSNVGSAVLSIPIEVPPGRRGMQPDLAFSYDSARKQSVFGHGWDIGLSVITRSTRNGVPKYNSEDRFELDGQLLVALGLNNEYRTRRETFRRVEYVALRNAWRVTDPDGTVRWFGLGAHSRRSKGTSTHTWGLDTVIDVYGNAMTITYAGQADEVLRPDEIRYTLRAPNGPDTIENLGAVRRLKLLYTEAPESRRSISYRTGAAQIIRHHVSEIQVWFGGDASPFRRYVVEYKQEPHFAGQHLVESIQMFGSGAEAMPAWTFDYTTKTPGFGTLRGSVQLPGDEAVIVADSNGTTRGVVDLDRDGFLDRLDGQGMRKGTASGFASTVTGWIDGFPTTSDACWNGNFYGIQRGASYAGDSIGTCLLMDVDGDGFPDLLRGGVGNPSVQAHLGSPAGISTAAAPGWSNPGAYDDQGRPAHLEQWRNGTYYLGALPGTYSHLQATFMDMNGDGRTDRVVADSGIQPDCHPSQCFRVHLKTESGWTQPQAWANPTGSNADFDRGFYSYYLRAMLNGVSAIPDTSVYADLIDFNGDGLPDRVKVNRDGSGWAVSWNTGTSFTAAELLPGTETFLVQPIRWAPGDTQGASYADLVDVNGDSLPDRVEVHGNGEYYRVWLNTGGGFDLAAGSFWLGGPAPVSITGGPTWLLDLEGDGVKERVIKVGSEWKIFGGDNAAAPPYLLQSARNDLGGEVTFAYGSSLRQRDADQPGAQLDNLGEVPDPNPEGADAAVAPSAAPMPVVVEQRVRDGRGGEQITTYAYRGARYDYAEREFRGFRFREVRDAEGHRAREWRLQGDGLAGRVDRIDILNEYSTLVRRQATTWTAVDGASVEGSTPGAIVARASKLTTTHVSGSNTLVTSVEETTIAHGAYNQVEQVVEKGIIAPSGGFPDVTSTLVYTVPNLSKWILPLPWKHTTSEGSGTLLRDEEYLYDGVNPGGAPTAGSITTIKRAWKRRDNGLPIGLGYTSEHFGYDAISGNQVWAEDERGYRTHRCFDGMSAYEGAATTYPCPTGIAGDGSRTFAVSERTALGHEGVFSYDPRHGSLASWQTPFGVQGRTMRDVFGRVIDVFETPVGGTEQHLSHFDYVGIGNPALQRIEERAYASSSSYLTRIQYLDGLGREYRTSQSADNVRQIGVERSFSSSGNVASITQPYFCELGQCAAPPTVARSHYTHDALNRVYIATAPLPNSGTSTSWIVYGSSTSALARTVITGNGSSRTSTLDWKGRELVVDECSVTAGGTPSCSSPVRTTRSYWGTGELRSIVGPDSTISIDVDTLGRQLRIADPSAGVQTFGTDPAGNVTSHTNARGAVIQYQYDAMGRPLLIDRPDGDDSVFEWDEVVSESGSQVARGRLRRVATGNTVYRLLYDGLGRLQQRRQDELSTGSMLLTTIFYDRLDRVSFVGLPGGGGLRTYYDGPFPESVCRQSSFVESAPDCSGSIETYVSGAVYDAYGGLESASLGNGMQAAYTRDVRSGVLTQETVSVGATAVLSRRYADFDGLGQARRIDDLLDDSRSVAFTFDGLNRVKGYALGAGVSEGYVYSNSGNVTQLRSATENRVYGNSGVGRPHQLTEMVESGITTTFEYDADGNVKKRGNRFLTHAHDGTLVRVGLTAGSDDIARYRYDHSGQRVQKTALGVTTFYSPDSMIEYDAAAHVATFHVEFAGRRIASTTRDGIYLESGGGNCAGGGLPGSSGDALPPLGLLACWALAHAIWVRRHRLHIVLAPSYARIGATIVLVSFTVNVLQPLHSIAMPRVASSGAYRIGTLFYASDSLASNLLALDPSGAVTASREYAPFGSASVAPSGSATIDRLYTDQFLDSETGFYYLNARYYDPEAGRFLEPDPIVGDPGASQSLNRYAYAENNPTNRSDPSGLTPSEFPSAWPTIDRPSSPNNVLAGPHSPRVERIPSGWANVFLEALKVTGAGSSGVISPSPVATVASRDHTNPLTVEVSGRFGLGVTVEGSAGLVSASLEVESVEEHTISLPGGASTTLANRAIAKVAAFGYEGSVGWEEEYRLNRLMSNGTDIRAGWKALQGSSAPFSFDWKYTGEIPGKFGAKLGGTLLFGASAGGWVDLQGGRRDDR